MNDLFGQPVAERTLPPAPGENGKRRPTKPAGYAAIPGTGPAGETCRTCEHLAHTGNRGRYLKCRLERARWTGGPGTDIKAGSPACSKWEPKPFEHRDGKDDTWTGTVRDLAESKNENTEVSDGPTTR